MQMKQSILSFLFALGLALPSMAQQKIGNNPTTIQPSAAMEVESTTKGFLPPRMTTVQRDAISSPAAGLTIFNTTDSCLQWFNGAGWYNGCDGSVVGLPVATGACTGVYSFFTFNGKEYKPVESGGKCWLDRNLGADKVATAPDDTASYGDLYQWGRATEGHEKRTSPNTFDLATSATAVGTWTGKNIRTTYPPAPTYLDWVQAENDNLWQGVNGINNPCPAGFRLPIKAEWDSQISTWVSPDYIGAASSLLHLPAAGIRIAFIGDVDGEGTWGTYWSSTVSPTINNHSYFLDIEDMAVYGPAITYEETRLIGCSVRCIKD